MKIADICKYINEFKAKNYGEAPKKIYVSGDDFDALMTEFQNMRTYGPEHEVVQAAYPIRLRQFKVMDVPVVITNE